jgi:hypothetical protein
MDVCLYGRDIGGASLIGGESSGLSVMDAAFRELGDLLKRGILTLDERRLLDRFLTLLDDHFPDHTGDLRGDLLNLGVLLRREERDGHRYLDFSERRGPSWRHCFSSRLQASATFAAAESIVQRALALESQPWSVAGPGNQELSQELSRDPLLDHTLRHLAEPRWAALTRGSLRLLRVAAHYLATGDVPEIDDPVGGKIRSRPMGDFLLIWKRSLFGTQDWEPSDERTGYDFALKIAVTRPQ